MVALVILPGLDGTGLLLTEFAASFGPEVEVISVTYPNNSVADYSELDQIARAYLPTNRPFFLLGESFSGPIAISIAASSPPGLLGVVLCCSFARNPLPFLSFIRPLVGIFQVKALPLGLLSFLVLGRFSSPSFLAVLAVTLTRVSSAALRTRAAAVLAIDVAPQLRSVTVPVLYLRASEDRIVPPSSSTFVASLASDCRVVEFIAPHLLLLVMPSLAARVVSDFMGQVSSGSNVGSCFKKSASGCQAGEAGAQEPECTQQYMRILTTSLRRRLTRVAMLSCVAAAVANTARPRITVAQHFFKQLLRCFPDYSEKRKLMSHQQSRVVQRVGLPVSLLAASFAWCQSGHA